MGEHWLRPILDRFYSDRRNFHKIGNNKENAYSQAIMEIEGHREMPSVTRLEVVDYTPCKSCGGSGSILNRRDTAVSEKCEDCDGAGFKGRNLVFWDKDKHIQLSLQDEGRTLKVFITKRGDK